MEIIIANKIRIKKCPKSLSQKLIADLQMENPKYQEALKQGRSVWGIKPFLFNFELLPDDSLLVPRGYRKTLMEKANEFEFTIIDERKKFDYRSFGEAHIQYRPYQKKAVSTLITSGEEGLLIAPAGSGKTVIGLSLIPLLGQPTLWLTHTRALALQAIARISEFLPGLSPADVGFLGDSKWRRGNIIDVALIPTLVRRMEELARMSEDYGLVILDEVHHCPSSTFTKVVSALNPYYLYGLTATPYRRDKLEKLMFQTMGPELVRIGVSEVEASGGIVMPTVKYRSIRSATVYGNDIQKIIKQKIIGSPARTATIVGDILREAVEGNYCIVLTDRKIHADNLYNLIKIGWEKTGIATGKYSKKYVAEQAELLNNKEITVLVCTFALLGEGFDVKFLNRAFVTMPFRAEGKVEQLIGRIQRSAPGKKDAIVYDYVDVDIGVVANQFYTPSKNDCRYKAYKRLGISVEPLEN
jgi:superfamily II DNA or RNA helicase